jgi:multidrug efflux pump subunit AcrA (membrane-fusion protein)
MGTFAAVWIVTLASVGPVSTNSVTSRPAEGAIVDPVVENCLVSLIEEAQVPGREPGVLVALEAKEGMQVKAGGMIGRIDDSEPTMDKRIKTKEFETAKETATNDVNVRYAKAATDVAKVTYEKNAKAEESVHHTVAATELLKLKLEWRKAELQIEQAEHELKVNILTADAKSAAVDAADLSIRRRQITSPIDGVVVKIYKHVGEWVAPGDPVVRIVRVDHLRIEAFLNASDYSPQELDAKPVSVEVELARGRKEKFPGKVVFVSPIVEAGGEYRVLADVVNRSEDGQWLLRPGQLATMTMRLH